MLFTSVPLGSDTTKAFVGHNLSILKQLIDVGNQIRDMISFRLSVLVQRIREFAGRNLRYPAHAVVAYIPILVLTIIVRGSKFNYMLQHLWTEATFELKPGQAAISAFDCFAYMSFWWPC